jgi:hypothetical protein
MHTKSTPNPKGEETKSGKRRGVGRGKCPNLLMTSGAGCLRLTPAILATSEDHCFRPAQKHNSQDLLSPK